MLGHEGWPKLETIIIIIIIAIVPGGYYMTGTMGDTLIMWSHSVLTKPFKPWPRRWEEFEAI